MAGTNYFGNKHSTAARITQTMDDFKFSCQTAILSVTKTDTLLQGIDDYNQNGEINRLRP